MNENRRASLNISVNTEKVVKKIQKNKSTYIIFITHICLHLVYTLYNVHEKVPVYMYM